MVKSLELKPEDRILDVSAGTGLLAESVINKFGPFKQYAANDPSKKMLEISKYRLRYKDNVGYSSYYAEDLPFDDNSFDHLLCLNAFHYYTDQKKALANFRRILKDGGNLWLLNWNRVGLFVIANYFIKLLSKENINTTSLDEMKVLLAEHDFSIQKEETWGYRWWRFFFIKCS